MSRDREARAIAIILARGGSKRLPLKNLQYLGGRPLLAYPIELCRSRNWIERVVVSTDHEEIATVARRHGAEVPFRRPPEISGDVPSEQVTEHALRLLLDTDGRLPELVATLTPSTPLTSCATLEAAYHMLLGHPEWDCVTAVRPAAEHPEWMVHLDGHTNEATTLLGNPLDGEFNVSQNLPPAYYPVGAFWINRVDGFLRRPSLYGDRWGAVVMDGDEAIDIDYFDDLMRAQAALTRPSAKPG